MRLVKSRVCEGMLSCFGCVLFMSFSRQEYWNGLLGPPPGDLRDTRIKPPSLKSPALAAGFFTTRVTQEEFHFK